MGYRLVDDELPRLIAARLHTSAEVVEGFESRAPGFGERLLAGLTLAVPEVSQPALPADDLARSYCREAERIIREAARAGDTVILGRLGNAILGARPDVVRVFVHAPLPWRIANVASSLACSAHEAQTEIARIDEARRAFAREYYHLTWGDPHQYDLTLDTSRFGVAEAAGVIAAAVRAAAAVV